MGYRVEWTVSNFFREYRRIQIFFSATARNSRTLPCWGAETTRGEGLSHPLHSSLVGNFVGISVNFIGKFHRGSSLGKKIKILWRKKCVRRGIFRNVDVRIEGRFVPVNPYFVCNTAIGSLCDDFYRRSYDFTIKNR